MGTIFTSQVIWRGPSYYTEGTSDDTVPLIGQKISGERKNIERSNFIFPIRWCKKFLKHLKLRVYLLRGLNSYYYDPNSIFGP